MTGFSGRRVYVTGATGFIGGRVVDRLLSEGAAVTALVRPKTPAASLEGKGVAIQRGSVTEPATIQPAGHDVVIHAAAWVALGVPRKKEPMFRATNVEGTRNVLDAARLAGVPKAVHVSSVAAFGSTRGLTVDESYVRPETFKSVYEETKTQAHRVALEYDDLAIALAMPGVVVSGNADGPFDALFRRWARGRLPLIPKGDGSTGWVHLDDTVDGILRCALRGRGPVLLVDRNWTLAELFGALSNATGIRAPRASIPIGLVSGAAAANETVMRALGRPSPFGRELARGLRDDMRYDSSKARKELGWEPDLVGRLARELARGTR